MKTIGERLNHVRTQLGHTYSEVGNDIGVSGDAIRVGIRRNNVRPIYINVYCEKYNINKDWVYTGVGEVFNTQQYSAAELINIFDQNGAQAVSARELHNFLVATSNYNVVGEDFSNWIKRMLGYDFEKNVDYTIIEYNYLGNKISESDNQHVSKRDYVLTLDCAKQISMLQRNEKGKQARQYFIESEKKLQAIKAEQIQITNQVPTNFREALLLAANQQLLIEEQTQKIEKLEPRSLYFDKMITSEGLLTMEECAKLLNVPNMGRTKLYEKLRESGVIMKNSTTPYQHFVNKGYFELKEEIVHLKGGVRKVNVTTMTTQKGLAFMFKILGLTQQQSA